MALPKSLEGKLKVPAIAAPMFLVSGPDLVVAVSSSGLLGTFPALNQRSNAGYAEWLDEIESRLSPSGAPFGVNLIIHKSNKRLEQDLATTVEHRVPVVITSLGAVSEVVEAVHAYGGVVFHDVINLRHARKAAEAGIDGLIAVSAGAGGHAGTLNPFALLSEISAFFKGTLILSGAISSGRHIAAARVMGADLAYIGTRFIATQESLVVEEQKQMMVASRADDILYTPAISGIHANFLKPSMVKVGLDPEKLTGAGKLDLEHEAKAWKNVWSAGHGVGSIDDIPHAAELCERFRREYNEAMAGAAADPFWQRAKAEELLPHG